MSGKAHYKDIAGRIREIRSDPCNQHIARIKRAGEIVDGHLVAHNGLQVRPFDSCYMELLQANGGCHEPQEEFVFQEVLKHIPRRGCILELGAYWAFYSMWFAREVPEARCLRVEPRRRNLEVGQYNFARNGIHGEFFRSRVGYASLGVDRFLAARQLGYIDLLHADIQGSEFEMLGDARESLKSGKIGYIFIGTHSQELHYRCKYGIRKGMAAALADADGSGTYAATACSLTVSRPEGLEPTVIPRRDGRVDSSGLEQDELGLSAEAPTRRFLPALGQLWYRFTGEMRLHPRQLDAKTSSRDP